MYWVMFSVWLRWSLSTAYVAPVVCNPLSAIESMVPKPEYLVETVVGRHLNGAAIAIWFHLIFTATLSDGSFVERGTLGNL